MYIDERHFVKTATQSMDVLERMWSIDCSVQSTDRSDHSLYKLAAIKSTASTVQARGVYRAAVLCEDVLSRLNVESPAKLHSSLSELQRLINSYAEGLFEIDPEFAETINQPDIVADGNSDVPDVHTVSAQTLNDLLPLVKSAGLRRSLQTLMQPIAVEPFETSDRKTMSLDALIQPISNLVLSEARHNGKNVTVSYAADFADISFETGETLQDLLESACLNIVANGIEPAAPTQANAAATTPQISITGQSKNGFVLFSISWIGKALNSARGAHAGFDAELLKLEQAGGSYSFNKLSLTENLKSRHTLYLKAPMVTHSASGLHGAHAMGNPNYSEMSAG